MLNYVYIILYQSAVLIDKKKKKIKLFEKQSKLTTLLQENCIEKH